jgi:hypothetical protein
MPLVTEERYWALFYMPLYTFIHNLLNVLVQIANKMGIQKNVAHGRTSLSPPPHPITVHLWGPRNGRPSQQNQRHFHYRLEEIKGYSQSVFDNSIVENMAKVRRRPEIRPRGSVALTTWHHPQKLAVTSPTSGGRSVGIVHPLNLELICFWDRSSLKTEAERFTMFVTWETAVRKESAHFVTWAEHKARRNIILFRFRM